VLSRNEAADVGFWCGGNGDVPDRGRRADGISKGAETDRSGAAGSRASADWVSRAVGAAVCRFVCRLLLDFWRDYFSGLYQALLCARHGAGRGADVAVLGIPTGSRARHDAGGGAGDLHDASATLAS